MSQSGNQLTPEPSHTNVGKATGKAGAYGGSELGSRLGGAVGPPIIGGIIGNLVGEKVGEKAIHKTGIDEKVTEAGDKLAGVIGKRNVDKLGKSLLKLYFLKNISKGFLIGADYRKLYSLNL